jgi:hypothetical protein
MEQKEKQWKKGDKVVPMLNQLSPTPLRRRGSGYIDPRMLDLGTSLR